MRTHEERSERGFNLIEVVIALALLAAVLLTISGLFIQGSQSVNTGRDLTEATSLATDILEQMDKWAFSQLYTNFGGTTTTTSLSVVTTTTTVNTALNSVQAKITSRLPNSSGTIDVTPLGGANFGAAKGIRVKVTINWTLKLKSRSVSLETVRF